MAALVAYLVAGLWVRAPNQESTAATLGASATLLGSSWAASHASALPAARSWASAVWVKPVPNRLRKSRSRLVATGSGVTHVWGFTAPGVTGFGTGFGVGLVGRLRLSFAWWWA